MVMGYRNRIGQALGFGIAVSLMIWMAGCKTMQSSRAIAPLAQGELVGGGLKIEWTAPTKGTAYLIEATTNRIMETRSLDQGETYSFAATSEGQKGEFDRVFGIKLAEARFLLYFRAADSKSPVQ